MRIEQSFAFSDLPQVFVLAFLETLLSADNAVVLAVLTRALPAPLRKKALYVGVGSAFILRAIALLGAAFILEAIWIQLVGGAYLLYLSIRFFIKKGKSVTVQPVHSFWKAVLWIELLDFIFAVDSIVAGIAFIDANFSKLWIVYLGGILGILGIRYAADLLSQLISRFPNLERSAYLIVGWIGIKLGLSVFDQHIPDPLFWTLILALFLLGFYRPKR